MAIPTGQESTVSVSQAISRILHEGLTAVLVTLVETPAGLGKVGSKLLVVAETDCSGALGIDDQGALDTAAVRKALEFLRGREETRVFQVNEFAPELCQWGEAKLLFERVQREPGLVICGAGHVGASLAKLASLMGYHTTLIDDRSEFVNRERFPDTSIELVLAQSWPEAVRVAVGNGRGISVAIVTRGHSEDEECLRAVIDLGADYVGMIGSRRRTNIVLQRAREHGAAEQQLKTVHAPVGLDIGAVTPEEVALAIMAEIIAVRRGAKGGSLSVKSSKSKV